jgi:hypothetical protein
MKSQRLEVSNIVETSTNPRECNLVVADHLEWIDIQQGVKVPNRRITTGHRHRSMHVWERKSIMKYMDEFLETVEMGRWGGGKNRRIFEKHIKKFREFREKKIA